MKYMNNLEKLLNLQKSPFFSKSSDFTSQDIIDREVYYNLQEIMIEEAKILKKGDAVLFNFPKIKKGKTFFDTIVTDQLFEGTVVKPLYNKVRKDYEEDSLIPTIKCESGKYTFEVSPGDIVKL